MFKLIFLLLVANSSFGKDDIKWYLGVDRWAAYPKDNLISFDRFDSKKEIFFYATPTFNGAPVASLKFNIFEKLDSKSECRFESFKYKTRLKSWLTCFPYDCKEVVSKTAKEVLVNEPLNPKWMQSAGDEIKLCEVKPSFSVLIESSNDHFYYMILPSGKSEIIFGDRKLYADLRFCKDRNESSRCRFNIKLPDYEYSLSSMKALSKRYNPLKSFIKSPSCIKDISSVSCLEGLTLTEAELKNFDDQFGFKIKKIKWTRENIEELKACLNDGSQIDEFNYKGIKKKCLRTVNSKIAVIDYPEAFVTDRQLEFNNFLKP